MNVEVGTALHEFINQLLATGIYKSKSEVVRDGLRLLQEKVEATTRTLAQLRSEIALGTAQADRGEFVDGASAFAEIRRRSADRRA